jgi:hypothetical protein
MNRAQATLLSLHPLTTALLAVALLGVLAPRATHAVIQVESQISAPGGGIRAQAIITDDTTFGDGVRAIAIKEISASMLVRDSFTGGDGGEPPLSVFKRQLDASQAYGQGLPQGWQNHPPDTDQQGPWQGLVWPYRDQYDHLPDEFDPLGDDVGTEFTDPPDVYGFVNINGISRGGPTDPIEHFGFPTNTPQWLNRGITGNGHPEFGPASYFLFDITARPDTPQDRTVRIQIFAASCIVVTFDQSSGQYGEQLVQIPDKTFFYTLPEPTGAAATAIGLVAVLAKRRRR